MKIVVNSIHCVTGKSKTDKVFIIHQSDAGVPVRYPATGYHEMSSGDTWAPVGSDGSPAIGFDYSDGGYLSLWGEVWPIILFDISGDKTNGSPKILGNAFFTTQSQSGSLAVQGNNGSSYTVSVTITQS